MNSLEELFSLKGKVAIVTGAARGNGKAIASALRLAGSTVVLVDCLEEELEKTSEELGADFFLCDVTKNWSLKELVDFTLKSYKKIDILVNNAGVSFSQDFVSYDEKAWEKTYKVNLKAPFELSKLVAVPMISQKAGSIINITSLNAELAFPENPAYIAFKGALKQLTKSMAYDLGKHGIRANNLGPGYIKTAMTEKSWNDAHAHEERKNRTLLNRWGHPKDLAGSAIFLASDASSFVTGQDLYVDGGWSIKGI
jgi:NAD(P)-dependent dehydrogenase (short-subunit alcohol dehydrogenase family)